MEDEGGIGPCETAWRAHYAVDNLCFLARERLVMACGEDPVLLVPSWYSTEQREKAFALAVMHRYLRLFGQAELTWAVGLQQRIPEALALVGPSRESCAAD